MTVLWVRKKLGFGVDVAEKGARDYPEEYTIMTDQPRESRSLILNDSRVPHYGWPNADDLSATCVKVSLKQDTGNPYLWHARVEYSRTPQNKEDPQEPQKQPDERRQKWSYQFSPIEKFFSCDLDGRLFLDTAWTPFNPPPGISIFVDEWTVRMYEPIMDRKIDRGYMKAVNMNAWIGCEAGEAIVADISRNEVYEQGAYWFDSTYKILVQPRIMPADLGGTVWDYKANAAVNDPICPWDQVQPNFGPRELDTSSPPKPIPIKTGDYYDGQPCPLDRYGHRIPLAAGGGLSASPLYLYYRLVNPKNLYDLPIYPPWLQTPEGLPHSLADR